MKKIVVIILSLIPLNSMNGVFEIDHLKSYDSIKEYFIEKEIRIIMESIKYVESRGNYNIIGGSGEIGAYQFMPYRWRFLCYKYFGEVLEYTPQNQDTIAYLKIREYVKKGYSIKEIALLWNAGTTNPARYEGYNKYGVYFNIKKYIDKVVDAYNKLKN